MSESEFTFIGFDAMEDLVRMYVVDAGYLVLQDRTYRGDDDVVGRFELTTEEARRWSDAPEAVDSVEDIVLAAVRWMRVTATRYALGADLTRFRLRVYAPKAYRMLGSGHFVVTSAARAA